MAAVIPYVAMAATAYGVSRLTAPKAPPSPPPVPNPNDATNAAQATTDQMRQRRGLLSNLYGGQTNQTPAVGKTQLGV